MGGVVVFLWWFRRAYGNLPALGRERHFDVGWSIGAWVVPVLNLFRPKGIADELWVAGDAPHAAARPSALVAWWWGWSLWRIGLLAPDQAGIAMLALGWWADPEFCVDDPDGSVTDVQWFPLREGLRLLREVPYPPLSIPAVAYLGRVAEPPMAWTFTLAEDADVERRWSWRSSVIGPEDDQPLTTSGPVRR